MSHKAGPLLRRRSDYEHTPPGVLVLVGLPQHLRVDARQDSGEHLVAEPLEVPHPDARDGVEDPLAKLLTALVGGSLQAKLDVRPQVAREARARDQALAIRRTAEVNGARPL